MFSLWFSKFNKQIKESDMILKQIEEILYPALKLEQDKNGKLYHIDTSADTNLYAALIDLEEGVNDVNTRKTIKSIVDKLTEIRNLLSKFQELDENAEYVIVEDVETGKVQKLKT